MSRDGPNRVLKGTRGRGVAVIIGGLASTVIIGGLVSIVL
jgi:hypothetical protein